MTSVLEDVGKDVTYSVFNKLKEWYSYIESYSDKIRAIEGKHRELRDLKETINSQVERESDNLRKPTTVTQGWLERVETLLTKEELKQLLDKEIRKRKEQCCFGRMQCNLYHLYDMSKAAENMAKELDAEINKKPDSSMVTEPVSVSDLKSAPGEFLGSLQSRVELMDKILRKLEDDDVDFVGIFGMGAIDGEVFMVEAFPRWRELETCKKYTTISLMSGDDHSRLGGLMSDNNLEMLLLDNTKPPEFDDTFFESMKKLKVLVLSGMNKKKCDEFLRIPTTSTQIWKSSLRTLHLECCELGDITGIGGLINLVVLSLRYSSVVELPGEAIMGNLVKLRLLDLRMCEIRSEGIPANVLGRLSQLEGLYLFDSNIKKWGHNSVQATDSKYASIDELNRLSYLNVLDINVRLEDLPIQGDQFVKNLERFKVRIWNSIIYEGRRDTDWSRSLNLGALDMRSTRTIECVKALLLKTEELILDSVKGFEEQYLQQENEWRNIKKLKISSCYKNVVESIKWLAFPNLENLNLTHLNNSRIIGAGNSTKIFSNLRTLFVWKLENLEAYVLPIHVLPLYHLTSLVVNDCNKLKYIFGEAERETHQKNKDPHPHLKLPLLEHLILEDLNKLESMVEVPNLLGGEASPTLFTTKDKAAFLNLKGLGISGLGKIKSLCPVSVAVVLVHLVSLEIYSCEEMTEAVVKDDDEESDGHGDVVLFPSLDFLKLSDCPKMGQFISAEQSCEFPSLRQLEIWKCDEMQSWSAGPSCRAPNLKHFDYQFGMQSIPEGGELNQFFKDRYQQRTHHPFLSVE